MKVLLTDLAYLHHNYGAQGILIPFIEDLRQRFNVNIAVTVSDKRYWKEDQQFAKENEFTLIYKPRWNFSSIFFKLQRINHISFQNEIKKYDVIIDLSGIEFIGNLPFLRKWKNLKNILLTQQITIKQKIPYYKYTKSYGPFNGHIYRNIVKKYLNKLPFIFVRTGKNFEYLKTFDFKSKCYNFPDISLTLEAEDRIWAKKFISPFFQNGRDTIGISPSVVINNIKPEKNNSCGRNHILLIKKLISTLSKKHNILLLPHSIGNSMNLRKCDLALTKTIYQEYEKKSNVKLMDDEALTYKQARAIIGELNFYITTRYHALASALYMKTPVIAIGWHLKYADLLSSYLTDFLAIDARTTNIDSAFERIMLYYNKQQWFKPELIQSNQEKIELEISKSTDLLWQHYISIRGNK